MKKTSIWRWWMTLVILLSAVTAMGGNINGYLTDAVQKENQMTIGGNRIEIVEEFEPPEKIQPASAFKKAVRIKNVGPSQCYVRVKAVFTDSEAGKYCGIDWNTTDFCYQAEDGFHYYIQAVEPERMTEYLFTTISVSADAPAESVGPFSVLVYAESCQSAGFDSYKEAWEYYRRNRP